MPCWFTWFHWGSKAPSKFSASIFAECFASNMAIEMQRNMLRLTKCVSGLLPIRLVCKLRRFRAIGVHRSDMTILQIWTANFPVSDCLLVMQDATGMLARLASQRKISWWKWSVIGQDMGYTLTICQLGNCNGLSYNTLASDSVTEDLTIATCCRVRLNNCHMLPRKLIIY